MKLMKKSDSLLMRAIGLLLRPFNRGFMRSFWTTIGSTIYVPTKHDRDEDWGSEAWKSRNMAILSHEEHHIAQSKCLTMPLFVVMYLGPAPFLFILGFFWWPFILLGISTLPLTVGLAYGRYWIERQAYVIQYRTQHGSAVGDKWDYSAEAYSKWVGNTLWRNYLFTWPSKWTYNWFRRNLL